MTRAHGMCTWHMHNQLSPVLVSVTVIRFHVHAHDKFAFTSRAHVHIPRSCASFTGAVAQGALRGAREIAARGDCNLTVDGKP